MSPLGQVSVQPTWNTALLAVISLMVPALSMCQSTGPESGFVNPQNCPGVCSCTNQLTKVVCTRRGLIRVPPNIPTNTRYLNLMENSIETIEADTFRHLRHLEVLQLGRNAIRQIEVGAFNGLTSLNTLELFDNRLTVIPSGAFEYLSKLRELWLRNNPIDSIPSYAFNRVPSLMRLDLGELRRLEYISEGAFEGLHNLKYLNLGMCNLRELPHLSPLVGLEELEISENVFPELKPWAFHGLKNLRKLWIMNSAITTIERNAFDDITALVELNLAHNNLSSLPHNLFTPLQYLVELHLHHNPWSCDCDVVWLSAWLRENIPTNSTCCGRCHTPIHMRGRHLVEIDQTTFQCSAPFILDAPRDLNISAARVAELRHGNLHMHVEVLDPTVEETPKPKPTVPASPSVFQPVFISTPTVLFQDTQTPKQVSVPSPKAPVEPAASLDEMMKTTKIIIGCFVAVTLVAAGMLIAFYKLRKRHQQRSTVAAARTIEIIQMEEQVPPVPQTSRSSGSDETGLALPTLVEHNSNTFKPGYVSSSSSSRQGSYRAHWTQNNSLHRSVREHHSHISTITDPYVITTTQGKEKVQETQI
ncbi:hypothetical protein OJAV_G00056690 [Oryzias javanicus]|uniref:LRRCT domain-containing protein n=1 Tax=Oryzias javanicus TaxID=123683 RepID=A0A3S2UIV1_ORYJA|nr:hypothetical protein OJAV_G00056690 [Oryzias javanicus]